MALHRPSAPQTAGFGWTKVLARAAVLARIMADFILECWWRKRRKCISKQWYREFVDETVDEMT